MNACCSGQTRKPSRFVWSVSNGLPSRDIVTRPTNCALFRRYPVLPSARRSRASQSSSSSPYGNTRKPSRKRRIPDQRRWSSRTRFRFPMLSMAPNRCRLNQYASKWNSPKPTSADNGTSPDVPVIDPSRSGSASTLFSTSCGCSNPRSKASKWHSKAGQSPRRQNALSPMHVHAPTGDDPCGL